MLKIKTSQLTLSLNQGTTTEPAIAFRVFKELLVKKYGQEEANKRIYATTDRQKVQLKLKQMLTVGKLSLFQMTSVDVSQY